ncbi:hypothetical protein QWZ13_14630 [Reinekea marina]|nr:hypothetical protein [Reinekea marina]MDN3650153.1 hypothetical protein [Reinekea marina]
MFYRTLVQCVFIFHAAYSLQPKSKPIAFKCTLREAGVHPALSNRSIP